MSLNVVKSLQEGELKQTKQNKAVVQVLLGGPVAKTLSPQFRGLSSIPSRKTRSHYATKLRAPMKQYGCCKEDGRSSRTIKTWYSLVNK